MILNLTPEEVEFIHKFVKRACNLAKFLQKENKPPDLPFGESLLRKLECAQAMKEMRDKGLRK